MLECGYDFSSNVKNGVWVLFMSIKFSDNGFYGIFYYF